jgi:hypothetical protein
MKQHEMLVTMRDEIVLNVGRPDADAGAHMTIANNAIASAQKDIVTAFIRHRAAVR